MKRKSNLFRGKKKEKLFFEIAVIWSKKKQLRARQLCKVDTPEIPSIRPASENQKCYLSICATLNVNTFYSKIL